MNEFIPNKKITDRLYELYQNNKKFEVLDIDSIINEIQNHGSRIEDLDELNEIILDNNILAEEFHYYVDAMKFLLENDPSLSESMEIAYEYGYDTKSLNSTMLASLLASRQNEEDWYSLSRMLDEDDFDTDADIRDHNINQILE
jgi:hypothetical protein